MKRIYETGRSMVEMLGTLAIVGVLSIGGITGYSYGMDKYRANETLNELQIRIIDLSQQMQNGAFDLSLGEMGNTTRMGYPISARVSPQFADYFEVFVDNVPSGVCHRLLESKWTVPYSIFVGIDEYEADESICDKAETVRLAYEFKDDLTDGETIAEEERHETWRCNNDGDCKCATCENGLCATLCPEGSSCAKSYDNPNSWMCCLNEKALNGLCCSSIGENGECCTSSDNCCPPDKPLRGSNGLCYSCDDETVVNVEGMTQNCAVCSNRLLTGSKKYCALKCGLKGTSNENKPLMDKDGTCHACNEAKGVNVNGVEINCNVCAKEGRYISKQDANYCVLCGVKGSSVENKPIITHGGTCYSCDATNELRVNSPAECVKICPNRVQSNRDNCWCGLSSCSGDTPLNYRISGSSQKCFPCDYNGAIPLVYLPYRQCTELCSNRKVEGDKCVLASCPADKPLMDKDGGCHACDEANGVNVNGVESNCDVCAKEGRYISKQDANYCVLCGVKGTSVEDKPIIVHGGNCYGCEATNELRVNSPAECVKICPNRVQSNRDNCWCGLSSCSGDTPLNYRISGSSQKCFPCDYNGAIPLVYLPYRQCTELCSNRKVEGDKCVLASCPADKPLMDKDGGCHACDEAAGVNVNGVESNCDVCAKEGRYISKQDANYCVLCGVEGSSVEKKPLIGHGGTCYSCNEKNCVRVNSYASCAAVCPNRNDCNPDHVHCGLGVCTDDVPLMDSEKNCHPCNEPTSIYVGADENKCKVCVNRRYEDGYCLLN